MKSWTQRNLLICFCALCLLRVGDSVAQQASPSPSGDGQASASATVPRLIRFSGVVKNAQGQPRSGVVGITFALYKEQEGGAALWLETQNVAADAQGQYVVLLGSTAVAGIPMDAFSANEARWLGVQPEGQAEQRVLLVSVPYALKAADAETLGGMPASSFVLAAPVAAGSSGSSGSGSSGVGTAGGSSTSGVSPAATCATPPCPVVTSGGTANTLALFTDATTVQNSVMSQSPCPFDASQTCVGIANPNAPPTSFTPTPSPTRVLDVNGEIRVGGGNIFMQRDLTDLSGRRNWAWGTETFNVGDVSLFVSSSNVGYASISPVFTALSNGFMGIGVGTPHANLEIAGSAGGGLLVDSPGVITGNGSGLTNLNAGSLGSGTIPSSALTGVNGSGLINLNAASVTNVTGTLPAAALPPGVAFQNAANTFTAPQSINAAPSAGGVALGIGATGSGGVNGLFASTNDPAGNGAIITTTASPTPGGGRAYILSVLDSTGNNGLRINTNALELNVPIAERISNDATGTTLNTLVTYTSSGTVATVPTSGGFAATGAIGIVVSDAGTSGKATVAFTGIASCIFDNATSVGDYVVPSVTVASSTPTAGDCHDYGTANGLPRYPLSGVQIVGRVLAANPTPGTPTQIYLYGYETRAIGQIASFSFTSQTAAIPANTLFTPLIGGLFRVNLYMASTGGTFTGGAITANITWADENGSRSHNNIQLTSAGSYVQGTVVIHALPGQSIEFATTYTATGPPTYEAFVTLERMQ